MAAKGAMFKEEIVKKLADVYGKNFFISGKELRICGIEKGEPIQIKVALTCAKENIENPNDVDDNNDNNDSFELVDNDVICQEGQKEKKTEPTPEEKRNVEDLLEKLGLK